MVIDVGMIGIHLSDSLPKSDTLDTRPATNKRTTVNALTEENPAAIISFSSGRTNIVC